MNISSDIIFKFHYDSINSHTAPYIIAALFIEKIVVHEKEVKWSKHAPQTVEIYYNGIGYVGSGQQDVEEALEALESLQTQDTEKPRQAS